MLYGFIILYMKHKLRDKTKCRIKYYYGKSQGTIAKIY